MNIVTLSLGISQEYRQSCIDEAYKIGDTMKGATHVKGIMSSYEVWNETKVFDPLLNSILKVVNSNFPVEGEFFDYQIADAWSAIYKKGHYTTPHSHKPAQVSFVYYLKTTSTTPIVFDGCDFEINPTDDMLVLFDSLVLHSVPVHTEEEDRICVAGNLGWVPNNNIN